MLTLAARCWAQCPTNTDNGLSYRIAYPRAHGNSATSGTLVVMSDASATVGVSVPACAGSPFALYPSPGSPAVLEICAAGQFRDAGPSSGYDIEIARTDGTVATLHVALKVSYPADSSDDAYLALPIAHLGNRYWAMGYALKARWLALAEDALTLGYRNCSDTLSAQAMSSQDVFQQTCQASDSRGDGTGYLVDSGVAGSNFSFYSGADCARVPTTVPFCETLTEMIPPEGWFGTEYLVTEFNKKKQPPTEGDLFRIMALASSASVTLSGVTGGLITADGSSGKACTSTSSFTLASGDWCDLGIRGGAEIASSSGSIMVGQFMKGGGQTETGDPSFVLATPTSHLRCSHRFFSFAGFPYDATDLDGSYVNIVAKTADIAAVQLDGSSLSSGTTCLGYSRQDFPGGTWSWTKCRLADPGAGGTEHTITTSSDPVAAYVYGQRLYSSPALSWSGAYAYPAGIGF